MNTDYRKYISNAPTLSHDGKGMYLVKEVSECRFDVVQFSSGVVVASAAGRATAEAAAQALNACAVVPRLTSGQ